MTQPIELRVISIYMWSVTPGIKNMGFMFPLLPLRTPVRQCHQCGFETLHSCDDVAACPSFAI